MQLQKEKIDNKLKINKNLQENALGAVKPYFGTQKMFNCTFVEHRCCIMWPLNNENKRKLDKEKIAKLCNTCFSFEKNLFPKT